MDEIDENLDEVTENTETGVVKWFSPKKGYGFIIRDTLPEGEENTNKEIFVHYTQVDMEGFKTLLPDLHVSYTVTEGKRPGSVEAINVKILTPPQPDQAN